MLAVILAWQPVIQGLPTHFLTIILRPDPVGATLAVNVTIFEVVLTTESTRTVSPLSISDTVTVTSVVPRECVNAFETPSEVIQLVAT